MKIEISDDQLSLTIFNGFLKGEYVAKKYFGGNCSYCAFALNLKSSSDNCKIAGEILQRCNWYARNDKRSIIWVKKYEN